MRPYFRYALLLSLGLVDAAPLLLERDITTDQFSQLQLFSQYAGAAYCYGNVHNATGNKLSCSAGGGSCPSVESAQTKILQSFTLGASKTTGFVAVDDTNKLVVASIQGTSISSNPIDILTDIDIIRVNTNLCGTANKNDGCEIHLGFWTAMNDVLGAVKTEVTNALKTHPGYKVISTGHSLGGAVAALLGAALRNAGTNVDIYTYGQPKVGTVDVSNFIQNQAPSKGGNYRVTHFNDIVPQLPEHSWDNWDHYYPEFWISLKDGAPKTTDIQKIDATLFSTAGNEGKTTGNGVLADVIAGFPSHMTYFGKIAACSSDPPST